MQIGELKGSVPNELLESAIERGLKEFTPPQELAFKAGLTSGANLVISSPTASGKTLIAEIAIIKAVIGRRKKAVYVAPMRALVSEKYEEFKSAYPYLKIAMSIGDLDSLDPWLSKYDIVFVSTEKLDSLIRHGLDWLDSVGCIIFDEIHMLEDQSRGPTLEILITKLRRICRETQLIALSATIGNADEIAKWLNANLVESDYRPVRLEKGIVLGEKAYYRDEEELLEGESMIPEARIVEDVLSKGKQAIIFYATKRNTEAGAERLRMVVRERLKESEKQKLKEVSKVVLNALSRATTQCEKLASYLDDGIAFHHSGLVNEQRRAVENAFREGLIKIICSTTTLGLGINMPAQTVVVRDTSRYGEASGAERLSTNEVTQLFGRAGRPKYDKTGRALLIAKSRGEIMDLYEKYIDAPLEPINSSLGMISVLRSHVLAFIATRFLRTEEGITNFFVETFYGHQYSNIVEIKRNIAQILRELQTWEFVERRGDYYNATKLGERVSELYIDPLSAKWIFDTLKKERDDIANLFMIANVSEMRPYVRATSEAEEKFVYYDNLLSNPDVEEQLIESTFGYYDPVKPFSTALMLHEWIEEKGEREIVKKYATTPGALFTKVTNADWLLYAATEISKIMRIHSVALLELRVRMRYGIKKELLDLVSLEQVGRVRARAMYIAGIMRASDLRKPGMEVTLERMFGKEIAKKIIDQVKSEAHNV